MKRQLITLLAGFGLVGAAGADETGWFVERPGDGPLHTLESEFLSPSAGVAATQPLQLSAGFRFSQHFTLSAALDEYLLDHTRFEGCLATDFVCLSAQDRSIEYGTAYSFALAPALRLDDDLSIYGHLGVRDWDIQVGGDGAARSRELMFGLGVGYDISNPFRLQLEYRSMDLDIKLTSIGFTWRF